LVYATTDGVVRPPSALVTMVGLPPSIAATWRAGRRISTHHSGAEARASEALSARAHARTRAAAAGTHRRVGGAEVDAHHLLGAHHQARRSGARARRGGARAQRRADDAPTGTQARAADGVSGRHRERAGV
jgi:hypothetical protein